MDQIDLAYPLVIEGESPGFNDSQGSPLTSTVSTSNNEPEVENKAPKTKNTEPKEYQFINEDGKAYRPYTDPSRIRANDAKKQSGTDRRAQVRGVPGEFMHVMKLGMRAGASTHSQPNSESGEP